MTMLSYYCDCGLWIEGEMQVELLANMRDHIDDGHPERADLTDDQLIERIEEQLAAGTDDAPKL